MGYIQFLELANKTSGRLDLIHAATGLMDLKNEMIFILCVLDYRLRPTKARAKIIHDTFLWAVFDNVGLNPYAIDKGMIDQDKYKDLENIYLKEVHLPLWSYEKMSSYKKIFLKKKRRPTFLTKPRKICLNMLGLAPSWIRKTLIQMPPAGNYEIGRKGQVAAEKNVRLQRLIRYKLGQSGSLRN